MTALDSTGNKSLTWFVFFLPDVAAKYMNRPDVKAWITRQLGA